MDRRGRDDSGPAAHAASPRPRGGRRRDSRRARLMALAGLALISATSGAVVGARHVDSRAALVEDYAQAWEGGDYRAMHALLSAADRRRLTAGELAAAYGYAAATATVATVRAEPAVRTSDEVWEVPVRVTTRVWGERRGRVRMRVVDEGGSARLDWAPEMVFPGLRAGEVLRRETSMPPRASILARDGTPLAEGPNRLTDLGRTAAEVTGALGPVPPERARAAAARGLPPDALIGLSGIEREYEGRLAGRPGGRLVAGERVLAEIAPRRGRDVRTTIRPELQLAAVQALAGRYGGAVALDPGDGAVLAAAGIGVGAPQPPGSVFKIVTLAAALAGDAVERSATYPEVTHTQLEGVRLENADGELCGGTLRNAFAHSCNSVFAPLGAEVGAERLVAMAERFGFNRPVPVPGAQPSSIPPAEEIGDDLAVGSTAIGQGRVLATALQVASLSAVIAADGLLHTPYVVRGEPGATSRAVPAEVASTISGYMVETVRSGTGTAAAVPGVAVAGKTGTAELRSSVPAAPATADAGSALARTDDPTDTDAWFTAFAPARRPELAVAILLVGHGTGGANAAPAARVLLQAGLAGDG